MSELIAACQALSLACVAVTLYLIGRDVSRILKLIERSSLGIGEIKIEMVREEEPGSNGSLSDNESEKESKDARKASAPPAEQ